MQSDGSPLSWMDAKLGLACSHTSQRLSCRVKCSLHNALMFYKELFPEEWKQEEAYHQHQELTEHSFRNIFVNEFGYLYDYVTVEGEKDLSVRPNMIFAVSLPYSLERSTQRSIVEIITRELRTPKGSCTLSPKSYGYRAICAGTQRERRNQATTMVVFGLGCLDLTSSLLKLYGRGAIGFIERTLIGMEEGSTRAWRRHNQQPFDGNPPYRARGAISLAM